MTKRCLFKYFKTSVEIICIAVMLYVRFPLSLRNVEDLLHDRGTEVSHETVRFWWQRFGRMRSSQMFVSVHVSVTNHFNLDRSLTSRSNFKLNRTAALAEWRQLLAG